MEINEGKGMNTAIAIFVKTPGLSPVKTRLAQTIGQEKAEDFYRLSLKAVAKTAQQTRSNIFWAVAEKEGMNDPLWQDFERLYTGEGGLGERQYHIYSTLLSNYDRVFMVSADTPQLSPLIFQNAVKAMDHNDYVIGPANDGGYYLFGGKKPVALDIWQKVPWSTDKTRTTLEKFLFEKPVHLDFMTDVDTQNNLLSVTQEMPENMSDEQQKVTEWIKQNN